MVVVEGLDQLKINQCENIWPIIRRFKFLRETLFIQLSLDKLFANSILTWASLGYHKDGRSFKRSGREIVILKRSNFNS